VRLLDAAVDRILMGRVAGGYIFVHRMLMEHLAGEATTRGRRHGDTKRRVEASQFRRTVLAPSAAAQSPVVHLPPLFLLGLRSARHADAGENVLLRDPDRARHHLPVVAVPIEHDVADTELIVRTRTVD
jgi:hypothetical protein